MSRELFLGLDVGTQGTKGLVIDVAEARVVARAARAYGLIEGLPDGAAEQHPATWWEAVQGVAHELFAHTELDARDVAGVGVSGQQHGLVALDAAGEVIRPAKLWCDTTTAAEAEELSRAFARAVPAGFTAPKCLWMKRHEPERFARIRRVLLPHDWVNLRLTGRAASEAGDASGTGLFDPVRRAFDLEQAAWIDPRLVDALPELVAPGEPLGALTRAAARALGLTPGTRVASGGGDNMMSAIGSGATRPGVVVASLGTSGTLFAYSARPVVDPEGLVAPFCDSTGRWLPLACVMNCTEVLEEARAALGAPAGLDELTRAAERVPPGAGGLLFVPYLRGERVPDLPHATGALFGLRPGTLRPAALFRAALEGTALSLAWALERLRALGIEADSLRAVGGGARNALWLRILANATGVCVRRLAEDESAALGAALHAAWTAARRERSDTDLDALAAPFVRFAGPEHAPEPERAALYRELLVRFRDCVGRLASAGAPHGAAVQ